jgi:hypothetical protein
MPRNGTPKQKTSVAISAEARRLLALMAERSGISQSAVLELAIRERAKREKVELSSSALASAAITPEQQIAARERFRELMEKARAGFADMTAEEIEREVQRAVAEVRQSRRAGRR